MLYKICVIFVILVCSFSHFQVREDPENEKREFSHVCDHLPPHTLVLVGNIGPKILKFMVISIGLYSKALNRLRKIQFIWW